MGLEEMVAVAVLFSGRLVLLDSLQQAEGIVVFLFQVSASVRQGIIIEGLGEKEVFCPAGEDEFLPVDLFVFVSCDDWCPVILVERSEVLCDVAGVEFHPGEILHLVGGDEVEVGGAGGARIEHQDAALPESRFDLLIGDLEVVLVVNIPWLYAESYGDL